MIIIKIQGGLGNQLLQYSIGKVITERFGKKVLYDLSFFETDTKYTQRPYLLDGFMTEVDIATPQQIHYVKYPYGSISKVLNVGKRALNKFIFKKYYIGYDPGFFALVEKRKTLYLEGFWQSFEYYKEILSSLSSHATLKDSTAVIAFAEKNSLSSYNSVSVHIRRGDFLNKNAGTKVVELEYYEQAVPCVEKLVKDPVYYIFSDDIAWVKTSMGRLFKNAVYVSGSGLSDSEEFMLMKMCKHAILSNSTFCWFSTLLTDDGSKVVVHPSDWKNEYLNRDSHICPKHWISI